MSKYCAEVYTCHNGDCRNIVNVESLYKMLRDTGYSEKAVAKVRSVIVAHII